MPELPEVETFRRSLDPAALGKRITGVTVYNSRILGSVSEEELASRLRGRRFLSTRRHGKHLFVETDAPETWLYLHFGMSGYPLLLAGPEGIPAYTRALFSFEDGGALAFSDLRMFGKVDLVPDPDAYIRQRRLGPDALEADFDLSRFREALHGKTGAAKAVLLDQSVIAGIGNLYADEILYQARIHPLTPVGLLDEAQVRELYRTLREVLRVAVDRGADFSAFPDTFLLPRRHPGGSCPCGGIVERIQAAGRTTYFCPECQKRK
jgi:formamidopyrimidine-DNA glycosylase